MFTDEQLSILKEVKIKLSERDKEKSGGQVPFRRKRASQSRPRPKKWHSKFTRREILQHAPSTCVTSQAWFVPQVKAERESKGYYVGSRWSPSPQRLEANRRFKPLGNL